jgi:folate-dependent phosphoribosylglycinamide formyltransferase PurN
MNGAGPSPLAVVLICHEEDQIDTAGIASWLASSFRLAGIVYLRERPGSFMRKLRREYRRVGFWRLLDVILFRIVYRIRHAQNDARWVREKVHELRMKYRADPAQVPSLVAYDPNAAAVRDFLAARQPDLTLARCKFILQPQIFGIARHGTYVLHPGICPAYRNAHGCFWALVNRDLNRVGMTLLKVDAGIDTGPIYLQCSYAYDEARESHFVIQHQVVLENLDAITGVLYAIAAGHAVPRQVASDRSTNWGQPWLTAYLQWKRAVRGVAV